MTDPTVGVIGLGIMGGAFARHLVAAGLPTFGYDPESSQAAALEAAGGRPCPSASAVASDAEILITSLPHADALEDALFGPAGIAAARHSGLLVVETSTLALEVKERAYARLAESGIAILDAPIRGTGSQALTKDIAIFASGDPDAFDRARTVLAHLARTVRYLGEFGNGSKLKYIANLLVAVHVMAAAEALALGEKAGFDPATLVDLLTGTAAASRMLEIRGPTMAAGTYSTPMMKVDVFLKDLTLIANFAESLGASVPLFRAASPYFFQLAAQGLGAHDTAAVIALLRPKPASL